MPPNPIGETLSYFQHLGAINIPNLYPFVPRQIADPPRGKLGWSKHQTIHLPSRTALMLPS